MSAFVRFRPFICPEKLHWNWLRRNPSWGAMELIGILLENNAEERDNSMGWGYLSQNPYAIDLLTKYPEYIDWSRLCSNPSTKSKSLLNITNVNWRTLSRNPCAEAIALLESHPEFIDWLQLSANPSAISLLKQHPERINYAMLSENTNTEAVQMLEKHLEEWLQVPGGYCDIDWVYLSSNVNPRAIALLEKHLDKIDWESLSANSAALDLLEQHLDKIDWEQLSSNFNFRAIALLEQHLDKINWESLSANPAAIALLEQHPEKIDWKWISLNPNIFTYDYEAIKLRLHSNGLGEELMENRFHPKNISKFADWGFEGY